jgi:hypothetical protein
LNYFGNTIYIHELVGIATLQMRVIVKKLVWNTCKLEDETDWRIIDPYPPIV